MKKFNLNGTWRMVGNGYDVTGKIPGSIYSFLLDAKLMEDPFYRDNELKALEIENHEYSFIKTFDYSAENPVFLCADGIDTLADIYLNGKKVAFTNDMHIAYRFDVTSLLKKGKNEIKVDIHPVDPYIKAKQEEFHLTGSRDCMQGFGHIRKAHCMMGWDWGPRLPDGGIWRDIYLLEKNSVEITEMNILQSHENGDIYVTAVVKTDKKAKVTVTVTTPDGKEYDIPANQKTKIVSPKLWWPNGLGEQPLYTFTAKIKGDKKVKRVGLRTLKLIRTPDEWGETFYHEVNGVPFFAMGADYIPEDNILSRINKKRSYVLLKKCVDAHFNAIRVWGGGYYPDDWFFDLCDEMGIVVFFDMMFACSEYRFDEEFTSLVSYEVEQNLLRLRHHPSIAILSGNNEVEQGYSDWYKTTDEQKEGYLNFFEKTVPEIINRICPDIPYVPSSPSSHGGLVDPTNENIGDSHFWSVWHGDLPFTDYRKHFFRYLSEFGFQSFPCEKTVNSFTLPEERNVFSRIMEKHQRNGTANGKILSYLSRTFLYPTDFGTLLYASQLLQAEAIRYGVEHLRRNRGRCMGTLYWQLNDIWPVASWASIDSLGRLKALHYVAKRFYNPVLVSCLETGETTTRTTANCEESITPYETKAQFFVNNDTFNTVKGVVRYALRNNKSEVIKKGEIPLTVAPFSVAKTEEFDLNKTDYNNNYVSFEFVVDGKVISEGTSLFTYPKFYNFTNPNLRCEVKGDEITVYSDGYARAVEIDSPNSDFILSDNYFDMNAGSKTVKILEGKPKKIKLRSVYDIR